MIRNTAHCCPDWHYEKQDGRYNVKLCLYINRKRYYVRTQFDVTVDEWTRLKSPALKDDNLKKIRNSIKDIETKAGKILERLINPTFEDFINEYEEELYPKDKDPLISVWFDKYSASLVSAARPASYSDHLVTSRNSFESFRKGTRFSDLTKDYVEKYTQWMLAKQKSHATVQSYLRDLRTVYNYAISEKSIRGDKNPFGKDVYIGTAVGRKVAIKKEQIIQIIECALPTGSDSDLTRDMFVFQYVVNGINILDLCKFRQSNLSADGLYLDFIRKKTARTKMRYEPIRAFLPPIAMEIINKWGNKNRESDDYIFPFFNQLKGKTTNPRLERKISQQITKQFNKNLHKISDKIGLPVDITTGVARSSFATVLKNAGVPEAHIKEGMGHSSIQITEIYLKSSDDEQIKVTSSKLL